MPKFQNRSRNSRSGSKHKAYIEWNFEGAEKLPEKVEVDDENDRDSQRWEEGLRRRRIKDYYAKKRRAQDNVPSVKGKAQHKKQSWQQKPEKSEDRKNSDFLGLDSPGTQDYANMLMEIADTNDIIEQTNDSVSDISGKSLDLVVPVQMHPEPVASSSHDPHPFINFIKLSATSTAPAPQSSSLFIEPLGAKFQSSVDSCWYDIEGTFQGKIRAVQSINELKGLGTRFISPHWNKSSSPDLSNLTSTLLTSLQTYSDLVFDGRNYANDEELLRLVTLHILSHSLDGLLRVQRHNGKLRRQAKDDAIARRRESDRARMIRAGVAVADDDDDKKKKRKKIKHSDKDEDEDVDNNKRKKSKKDLKDADSDTDDDDHLLFDVVDEGDDEYLRDQGFSRPKSLILLPTIGCAVRCIQAMIDILGPETLVEGADLLEAKTEVKLIVGDASRDGCQRRYYDANKDEDGLIGFERLQRDLGVSEEDCEEIEGENKKVHKTAEKPRDWKLLFGLGSEDDFIFGIAMIPNERKKKKTIRLKIEERIEKCDIIIGSPLGIRMAAIREASKMKKKDKNMEEIDDDDDDGTPGLVDECYDFLSSIELTLLYQADVLLMQNWDHLLQVMGCVNSGISVRGIIDFSRVRNYFLEEDVAVARKYRQNIMISSFMSPEISHLINTHFSSCVGRIRVRPRLLNDRLPQPMDVNNSSSVVNFLLPNEGNYDDIDNVASRQRIENRYINESCKFKRINQTLHVAPCNRPELQDDAKFEFFSNVLLPSILSRKLNHVLIVTSTYFEYIRVRNELILRNASAAFVCEYSRVSEISRGRSWFFHGVKDIMCYSLRCHFYSRYDFRGVKHVLFYGSPFVATFYSDILNKFASCENAEEQGLVVDTERDAMKLSSGNTSVLLCTRFENMAIGRIFGGRLVNYILGEECALKTTYIFHQDSCGQKFSPMSWTNCDGVINFNVTNLNEAYLADQMNVTVELSELPPWISFDCRQAFRRFYCMIYVDDFSEFNMPYCNNECQNDLLPCAGFLDKLVGASAAQVCLVYAGFEDTDCLSSESPSAIYNALDEPVCPTPLLSAPKLDYSAPYGFRVEPVPFSGCYVECNGGTSFGTHWAKYRLVLATIAIISSILSFTVAMSHLEWKCFFAAAGEHAPSRPVGLSSWIPRINFVSVFSIVWVFSGLIIAGYQFADIKTTNLTCDGDIATSIRTPINVALGAIVVCSFDFAFAWSGCVAIHLFCTVVLGKKRQWLTKLTVVCFAASIFITLFYLVLGLSIDAFGNDFDINPGFPVLAEFTSKYPLYEMFIIGPGFACSSLVITLMVGVVYGIRKQLTSTQKFDKPLADAPKVSEWKPPVTQSSTSTASTNLSTLGSSREKIESFELVNKLETIHSVDLSSAEEKSTRSLTLAREASIDQNSPTKAKQAENDTNNIQTPQAYFTPLVVTPLPAIPSSSTEYRSLQTFSSQSSSAADSSQERPSIAQERPSNVSDLPSVAGERPSLALNNGADKPRLSFSSPSVAWTWATKRLSISRESMTENRPTDFRRSSLSMSESSSAAIRAWKKMLWYNQRTMAFLFIFGVLTMFNQIQFYDTIHRFRNWYIERLTNYALCILEVAALNPAGARENPDIGLSVCEYKKEDYQWWRSYVAGLWFASFGIMTFIVYGTHSRSKAFVMKWKKQIWGS